jgi:flavin-dependent dehydrogenase
MIDVAVAGGGPAGLCAAIAARLAGMRVVVVEPKTGPIDKPCGEGLMPAGVATLATLGVELGAGVPFRGIRYQAARDAERMAEGLLPAPGRGVRRVALHAALMARARELGVVWIAGRIERVANTDGCVQLEGAQLAGLRAGHLVAADGLHSRIRHALGLALPPRGPARYGVRRHFRVAPWSDRVEVHLAPGAEAYVTPVARNEVGIALLGTRPLAPKGLAVEALATRFPILAARLAGAQACSLARGAGPFEQRVRARVAGRVLLVGDAAGYVDPLTGEGVALGFGTACAAIEHIAAAELAGYERSYRRLVTRHERAARALLAIIRRPALHGPLLDVLARLPGAFDAALDYLSARPSTSAALAPPKANDVLRAARNASPRRAPSVT